MGGGGLLLSVPLLVLGARVLGLTAGLAPGAAGAGAARVRGAPGDSVAAALEAALAAGAHEVVLGAGVHRVLAPLQLTAEHSGLTLRGEPGAVIDGGVPLNFSARADGLWAAPLPPALERSGAGLSALFVNGAWRLRAREPDAIGPPPWSFPSLFGDAATFHMAAPLEPCTLPSFGVCPEVDKTGFFADMGAARRGGKGTLSSGAPNASWALHGALACVAAAWTWDWAVVERLDSDGRVTLATNLSDAAGAFGTQESKSPSGGRWFLEDFREALDAPGEFFVDAGAAEVLYVPLPGESPSAVTASMPATASLWRVAGNESAPAVGITLRDVALRAFGEGPPPRAATDSYVAALNVGPFASNISLLNVSVSNGVANAVGVCSNVSGLRVNRLGVRDIGGAAVKGVCQGTAGNRAFALTNSTISRTSLTFLAGAAVHVYGTNAAVLHNDFSEIPLDAIAYQQLGGPSFAAAPTAEIAYNHVRDFGQGVTSDFGAVYISSLSDLVRENNWLATDVHHNLVERAESYSPGGYGANGLYSDHGTSGTVFRSNVLTGLGGAGLALHCGLNLTASNNLVFNVSRTWGDGALQGCSAADTPKSFGLAAAVRTNIFSLANKTREPFSSRGVWDVPPSNILAAENNTYFVGGDGACVFPDGGGLAAWRAASGNDLRSVEADPQIVGGGNFSLLPFSPSWALGWRAIDLGGVGVLPEEEEERRFFEER